jgi:hypothetical protein
MIAAVPALMGRVRMAQRARRPGRSRRIVCPWKRMLTAARFAAAGAIIGLLAAGALLERFSWHSVFAVSAITAVIAAAAALLLAPNTRDEEKGSPDPLGALLTATAIGCLVFAIIEGNADGFTSPAVIAAIVVCVAGFGGFAVHGMRRDELLLDPRLFGRRGFRTGTITVVVQFLAVFGFFFVGLRYLLLILGYSPLKAAVTLVPIALLVIPVSLLPPASWAGSDSAASSPPGCSPWPAACCGSPS